MLDFCALFSFLSFFLSSVSSWPLFLVLSMRYLFYWHMPCVFLIAILDSLCNSIILVTRKADLFYIGFTYHFTSRDTVIALYGQHVFTYMIPGTRLNFLCLKLHPIIFSPGADTNQVTNKSNRLLSQQ